MGSTSGRKFGLALAIGRWTSLVELRARIGWFAAESEQVNSRRVREWRGVLVDGIGKQRHARSISLVF